MVDREKVHMGGKPTELSNFKVRASIGGVEIFELIIKNPIAMSAENTHRMTTQQMFILI